MNKLNISQELIKFHQKYGTPLGDDRQSNLSILSEIIKNIDACILCNKYQFKASVEYNASMDTHCIKYERSIYGKVYNEIIIKVFYGYTAPNHVVIHWALYEGVELDHKIINFHNLDKGTTQTTKLIYNKQSVNPASYAATVVRTKFKDLMESMMPMF